RDSLAIILSLSKDARAHRDEGRTRIFRCGANWPRSALQALQPGFRQPRRDVIERVGKLEALFGVIVPWLADQVAVLVAEIGDDLVGLLDVFAGEALVGGDVVAAREVGAQVEPAPGLVAFLVQIPLRRTPLGRVLAAPGDEEDLDRIAARVP